MNESSIYNVALTQIPGVGVKNAQNLIAYIGSAEKLFSASKTEIEKVPGIAEKTAALIIKNRPAAIKIAEKEMKFIEKEHLNVYSFYDKEFPGRLKECPDAPVTFFSKGEIGLNVSKILSVVGTRNASDYGKSFCNKLIKDIAERYPDTVIVSGLAYGIDICAHRAALENNLKTIAVLGHGLNHLYPSVHKKTATEIINKGGALVSEFLSGAEILPKNFVQRNRIIAGVSDAVIVVESARKGGSLLTAEIANSYNREVFALPGRVGDISSEGCNLLIKSHRANLIESFKDIEYLLGWEQAKKHQPRQISLNFDVFTQDEQLILNALKKANEVSIDTLIRETGLTLNLLNTNLLNLEFRDVVLQKPGKIFKLKQS